MPRATLRIAIDGREENISEYICDWPDCPRVGTHVLTLPALRLRAVICAEHAGQMADRTDR